MNLSEDVHRIMEEIDYNIACGAADPHSRCMALWELSEFVRDMATEATAELWTPVA